jgi:hypothetical protein
VAFFGLNGEVVVALTDDTASTPFVPQWQRATGAGMFLNDDRGCVRLRVAPRNE